MPNALKSSTLMTKLATQVFDIASSTKQATSPWDASSVKSFKGAQ